MATGRLGAVDLTAETNTTLYTAPSGFYSVANVNVCNRTNQAATIRIALSASGTPTDAEWVEYNAEIPARGILERTGLVVGAGQNIVAYSDTADVSAVAYGIEQEIL